MGSLAVAEDVSVSMLPPGKCIAVEVSDRGQVAKKVEEGMQVLGWRDQL